jgi:hypothetical protein
MSSTYTCFDGFRRISSGGLPIVVPAFQQALAQPQPGPVLLFDNHTGRTIDIDNRGSLRDVLARLASAAAAAPPQPVPADPQAVARQTAAGPAADTPRGRGRPRLGVVAREVTLLPRHWDWLATQTGGASVVLRRLVEQARRADKDDTRQRHERAFHFMSAIAGDLPGFEEAIRALFANDAAGFAALVQAWPSDVRDHAAWLAFGVGHPEHGLDATQGAVSTTTHQESSAP